jgi:Ca-activated chloride channel homolog
MTVGNPRALWLLLALVLLALLELHHLINGRRDLARLAGGDQEQRWRLFFVRWFFSSVAFGLFWIFAVFALADLSWGVRPVEEDRRGIEIAFVLDLSNSMLAQDVEPSRLRRAQDLLRALVSELEGSRFAVVGFRGAASRVVPMTQDLTAVESLLSVSGAGVITTPGSDLEAGLTEALEAFPEGSNRHRAIVLLSDGEALTGNVAAAAEAVGEAGIPVFSVGVGSRSGASIPLPSGDVIRDSRGRPVVTRLEEDVLRQVAGLTRGAYYEVGEPELFINLLRDIREYYGRLEAQGFRLEPVQRYRLFLSLALICLAVFVSLRVIRWNVYF